MRSLTKTPYSCYQNKLKNIRLNLEEQNFGRQNTKKHEEEFSVGNDFPAVDLFSE